MIEGKDGTITCTVYGPSVQMRWEKENEDKTGWTEITQGVAGYDTADVRFPPQVFLANLPH